jgi:hypothetical protein
MNQSADWQGGIKQSNLHVAVAAPGGLAERDQRPDPSAIGKLSGRQINVDPTDHFIHGRLRFGRKEAAIGRRQFSQVANAKCRSFAGNFHFTLAGS